ncbi:MAG: hypothetical protein JST47_03050 [Bacteroidetes bacterium]|nr:hypothetical protein [Bacteroidota bacterium]MBS1974676.1 hypothetical protein [Bacteroidota bacterium]
MKFLFSILFALSANAALSQLTYETLFVDYDSALLYKNLKIIPIRQKDNGYGGIIGIPKVMSLSDAIKKGIAKITERGTASTENVHWLRINNNSDSAIYVGSGEIISGGRQDRMVMHDTILRPSNKDQYIPVMCVEEDRWSDKEEPFEYRGFANSHLRKVLDSSKNQVQIWREIDYQLERGHVNSKSMAYLSQREPKGESKREKRRREKQHEQVHLGDDYFNYFIQKFKNADTSVVGIVCVSDSAILGCDIFAAVNLFNGQLPALLRGYIDEALLFGGPVRLPNDKVMKYMDKILTDKKSQEEFVSRHGKIFKEGKEIIHIYTY